MSPERSDSFPTRRPSANRVSTVWSVSRGIAAPASLPPDIEAALIAAMEDHRVGRTQGQAEALSLDPVIIRAPTTASS
jgi:hypothetical protein